MQIKAAYRQPGITAQKSYANTVVLYIEAMDMKGNKKNFYKYVVEKRKTKENMVPLWEMRDLVTQNMKRIEILNNFSGVCSVQYHH